MPQESFSKLQDAVNQLGSVIEMINATPVDAPANEKAAYQYEIQLKFQQLNETIQAAKPPPRERPSWLSNEAAEALQHLKSEIHKERANRAKGERGTKNKDLESAVFAAMDALDPTAKHGPGNETVNPP